MDDDLELARRCAAAMYANDKASQHLGISLDDVGPGRATARMPVTNIMINGHDMCHGGYVVALADSAFAFACNTYNQRTVAQGLDITFVRPARLGDVLVAEAVERARWGRSGLYDVTVSRVAVAGGASGAEVVAEFRGRGRVVAGTIVDEAIDAAADAIVNSITDAASAPGQDSASSTR
jgi:phenylacetic acid degradation protein PaaD